MEIRLQTLGPPRCYANGALTDLSTQRLRFALLLYLGVQRRAARETIIALLWPEREEERARHALTQTLYELRRTLGEDWLTAQADPLEVTDQVQVDALEFEDLLQRGDLAAALALYRGDFLEGFHHKDSNEFDAWLESKRRDLKRKYHRAVKQYIQELANSADLRSATSYAERWVTLDPLDDEANHALLQLLAQAGKRAEALAHYENYERRIKEELDVEPLEHTRELIGRLRDRRAVENVPAIRIPESASQPQLQLPPKRIGFWAELKQRRVLRFAWLYLATVFVVLQGGQLMVDVLSLPKWLLSVTAALAILAFPLALVLSWQFDLTPEGVVLRDTQPVPWLSRFVNVNWRIIASAFAITTTVVIAAFVTPLVPTGRAELKCSDGTTGPCREEVAIVRNRYVVLPLSHEPGVEAGMLDGVTCARLLGEGLSYWEDLNVVEQMRVNDVLRGMPAGIRAHIPVDTGLSIAQQLGAGKLIMGELWHYSDSTRVNAVLYDVLTKTVLKRRSARFQQGNSTEAEKQFNELAQQLVVDDNALAIPAHKARRSHTWAAVKAFDAGQKAIADWNLHAAKAAFDTTLMLDPKYTEAHLWLAYVLLWQRDTSAVWRQHAERALSADSLYDETERRLAQGVASLAARAYGAACENYRQLLTRDSASFMAWYGLSECLALNNTVLPDATSPSGWSFATSRAEAIAAHQRALRLMPSFQQAYANVGSSRLASLLFLSNAQHRRGVGGNGDTITFAAWPDLRGDTLSLVPYPYDQWRNNPTPPGAVTIIARHQQIFSDVATDWAATFPDNPRALLGLAQALERQGLLQPRRTSRNSALGVIERARKVVKDTALALTIDATAVRLHIKSLQFRQARELAQVMLEKYASASDTSAVRLAGIAGLIGRSHMMASLLEEAADVMDYDRPPTGGTVEVPANYSRVVLRLISYAHAGTPADSFRPLMTRAHAALENHVPLEQRKLVHAATLDRAERMVFPWLGAQDGHATAANGTLLNMQNLLARRDTASLKRALAELEKLRAGMQAADDAADGVLVRTQLYLAIRDTAAAKQTLDRYLNDLPNLRSGHFNQPYQPVAIVRMMVLRADLASASGEREIARRWARAVLELWRDGDNNLNPVLRRMRALSRS